MAELQGCSEILPVEILPVETLPVEILPAESTVESTVESEEPDILTLQNELKALVKYNRRLIRKTTEIAKQLSQITSKAEPPFQNARECNICFEEYSQER